MKGTKITELNTTDTYKLVDKEGWFNRDQCNEDLLEAWPELLTGFKLVYINISDGWYKGDIAIGDDEYKFFEIVTEQKQPILWDGTSEIEVGMVVKDYRGVEVKVEMVEATQVILRKENGLLAMSYIENLEVATKSPKEQAFDKVMEAWKRQGLGFAHDTKSSSATIERVFDVVYAAIEGEK